MVKLGDLVISIILVSVVIIGMSAFYSDLATRYDKDAEDLGILNQTEKIENLLAGNDGVEEKLEGTDFGVTEVAVEIFTGSVAAIQLLFQVPNIMFTMITAAFSQSGVGLVMPDWLSAAISLIIMSIFIFAILSAFFKWSFI